ncbi:DUF7479 domain-containing protein [Candidatus Methanomassiliicoccus intestinalis]|uniref:DUF7479 domain-containing protein n=1 Tax=Candidatus Methanomassiliicoccus intestinalis TaxID=1406512 RepID=UPI0037DC30C2
MDAKFSDSVKELIGERGLKIDDVIDVINTAEASGKKINNGSQNLAKKRIGEVTIYALYDNNGNVESAYSHRMVLGDLQKTTDEPDPTDWVCVSCNEKAVIGTVLMTYMGVTRSGPAVVCEKCGDAWVEEYLATKTIAAAEGLFEKKKA